MRVDKKTSDEKIAIYTREENKEFFAHIIDRYERRLRSYIHRWVGDFDDADDLLQQTFINAYVNLHSFDAEKKFSSWIYRIAHNVAINWLKKKKARLSLAGDETVMDNIIAEIDNAKEMANRELKHQLTLAIDKLPLKFKEPLMLKFFEDRSYEEISDILHKPKNTIGTMISRAKKLLKRELVKQI